MSCRLSAASPASCNVLIHAVIKILAVSEQRRSESVHEDIDLASVRAACGMSQESRGSTQRTINGCALLSGRTKHCCAHSDTLPFDLLLSPSRNHEAVTEAGGIMLVAQRQHCFSQPPLLEGLLSKNVKRITSHMP